VQVPPQSHWLQERLRRTAPVTPAHRELVQPVPGLDVAVGVPNLVTHFFAGLQESDACVGMQNQSLDSEIGEKNRKQ